MHNSLFILIFTLRKGCKIPVTCETKLHIKSRRVTTPQVRGLSMCLSHLNEDILFRLECTNIIYGRRLFPCSSVYIFLVYGTSSTAQILLCRNPGAGPLCFMTSVKSLSIIYHLHHGKMQRLCSLMLTQHFYFFSYFLSEYSLLDLDLCSLEILHALCGLRLT